LNEIVVQATFAAEASGKDPLHNHVVGNIDMNYGINVVAFEEELGLPMAAGKAIQNETVVPVMLAQSLTDHVFYDIVWHEIPFVDDASHLGGQLGFILNIPAKDIANTDVGQLIVAGQHDILRTFATALNTHDYVFM